MKTADRDQVVAYLQQHAPVMKAVLFLCHEHHEKQGTLPRYAFLAPDAFERLEVELLGAPVTLLKSCWPEMLLHPCGLLEPGHVMVTRDDPFGDFPAGARL